MKIHGHKLPDELYNLIKDKDDKDLLFLSIEVLRPLVPAGVKVVGGFFGGLRLSDAKTIENESNPFHLFDLGELYATSSSKRTGKPITELHILDADNALLFAVNHDEEALALDYRVDVNNPRILGSFEPKDWVLLADSFGEFVNKVGLSANGK